MSLNTTLTKCFPAVDAPTLRMPEEHMPLPTAVTLFSGLGSSSLALRGLGFDVLAHDFMREACSSLVENGFPVVQGDIRAVDFTDPRYRNVEVLVGGPPCQPFSQGGRNLGKDDTRDMIPDYIRAVAHMLPKFFVLENVRGLAGPRHREYLAGRVEELRALGYAVECRVLDAADYGTPQARKRLFILGTRLDVLEERGQDFPAYWPTKVQRQTTMAEALVWDEGDCGLRNLRAPEAARVTGGDRVKALWPLARPAVTVVGSFMPEVMAAPGYRNAGDGPRQNAPGSVVTTQVERLLLQEMPADWKVVGSKTKVDLQIGNSCPNGLLQALIEPNLDGLRRERD